MTDVEKVMKEIEIGHKLTDCLKCDKKKDCIHDGCFRRLPRSEGGLGLCPNLKDK